MDFFSSLLFVGECLLDSERVSIFEKVIKKNVKRGDTVVDAGTGSGIMALFAAKAGAKKVFALEQSKGLSDLALRNVRENNLQEIIKVINTDVMDFKLPKDSDSTNLLIMEMLDTGLVEEQQIPAVLSLKENGVISEKTTILPNIIKCYLEIINYDFDFYGFQMPFVIQARNFGVLKKVKDVLSQIILYETIDLKKINTDQVNKIISFESKSRGVANAILLKTNIVIDQIEYPATTDMNMPLVFPIDSVKINIGDRLSMRISYKMGSGFLNTETNFQLTNEG